MFYNRINSFKLNNLRNMPIEVLMPALSPTMTEGNLANWLKKEGDEINAGDVIAEIETDKATMEVEAVDEGILGKILVAAGTEGVAVNSPIALILEDGEDKKALANYKPKAGAVKKEEKVEKAPADNAAKEVVAQATSFVQESKPAPANNSAADDGRIKASPLAKRLAKENSVSLDNIGFGSGPRGRIVKEDVLGFVNSGGGIGQVRRNPQEFRTVKNDNIRKVIAKRLLESKQQVPHFYLNADLRIDNLLDLRAAVNNEAGKAEGRAEYKISVNDLVIKACAMALKKVPEANSSWSDDAIMLYNNVDVSVAVAIDGGLITPIVKNADQKSIIAISNEMKSLAQKAKENKLQPEEFQGGGFSISNLGMYGVDSFNAIVNPPQSCILAVGAGKKKPVIGDSGQIEAATVMSVTLSCDHRSVDGAVGALFLSALRKYVENPVLMFV